MDVTTTKCVFCKEDMALGDEARAHYANIHPEKGPKTVYVSINELVRLAPNLTIKPLGEGLSLVCMSCGCGANVCYNTAGCPTHKL